MRPGGINGSYREAFVLMVAHKICCSSCGYSVTSDTPLPYELWYRAEIFGHTIWANNRAHLDWLILWLSGPRKKCDLDLVDRACIETLPTWMIRIKNRERVLKKLEEMSWAS